VVTPGEQVVSLWAFGLEPPPEIPDASPAVPGGVALGPSQCVSLAHSKDRAQRLHFGVVLDTLVDPEFRPLLSLLEDSSPGLHDSSFSAGRDAEQACRAALEREGTPLLAGWNPPPLNLFFHTVTGPEGELAHALPVGSSGDIVTLRAERRVLVVAAACEPPLQAFSSDAWRGGEKPVLVGTLPSLRPLQDCALPSVYDRRVMSHAAMRQAETASQVLAMADAFFDELDQDGDGVVTTVEFEPVMMALMELVEEEEIETIAEVRTEEGGREGQRMGSFLLGVTNSVDNPSVCECDDCERYECGFHPAFLPSIECVNSSGSLPLSSVFPVVPSLYLGM